MPGEGNAIDNAARRLDSEVHLWLARPEIIDDPERSAAYFALLCESERKQYFRYRVERARRLHLTTRALLRTTLSRYAPIDPVDWRFRANRHGRPEIESPREAEDLKFNLSHTTGLVAVAVTRGGEVGVDVEHSENVRNFTGIAKHSFSPLEEADVCTLQGDAQRNRFFSYWTLKESYIKARGMGLAIPLAQFSFSFSAPGRLTAWFDERLGHDAAGWQFALFRASPEHHLAVAVQPGAERDFPITARWVVPLANEESPADLELIAQTPKRRRIPKRPAPAPAERS